MRPPVGLVERRPEEIVAEAVALAQKLIGAGELGDLKAALRRHIDDPQTLIVSHLFFQAWGRKPEHWHLQAVDSGAGFP